MRESGSDRNSVFKMTVAQICLLINSSYFGMLANS